MRRRRVLALAAALAASSVFALPLVVAVPLLLNAYEERSRTRRRAFEWVAGSGLVLAVVIAQLYEFYLYHG